MEKANILKGKLENGKILRRLFLFGLLCVGSFLLSACLPKQPDNPLPPLAEEAVPEQQPIIHKIKYRGETLGIIAKWYTGKSDNWRAIMEANPGLKPEKIKVGMTINIPEELVVQKSPLPEKAVKSAVRAVKTKPVVEPVAPQTKPARTVEFEGDQPAAVVPAKAVVPQSIPESVKAEERVVETISQPAAEPVPAPTAAAEQKVPPRATADDDKERERLLDELLAQ